MLGIHSGPISCGGLVELTQQIRVVLAGKPWTHAAQLSLAERPVTTLALPEVDACTTLQRHTVADAALERRPARQAFDVRSDVEQVLWPGQSMAGREVLHALIPAAIGTEIDQLLDQHRDMLTRDGRYSCVIGAATVGLVACCARTKQRSAVLEVRFELQRCAKLGARSRGTLLESGLLPMKNGCELRQYEPADDCRSPEVCTLTQSYYRLHDLPASLPLRQAFGNRTHNMRLAMGSHR